MAPVPAREPGVRPPGPASGAPLPRRRLTEPLLAAAAALVALHLAHQAGVAGPGAVQETVRVTAAAVAVFALCGLALVRVALPASLRRHELLWVPAAGACVLAVGVAAPAYVGVPYAVALAAVLGGAALAAVVAVRRHGPPAAGERRALAWPVYLAALGVAVAMIPMLRSGFATVIGSGSDAHMAVGVAQFLQSGHHPLAIVPEEPVDEVWPLWRSKVPIYYAFAAVSSVSGMEPYEVIAGLSAVLMALAGLGFYLLARERLGAGVGAAAAALGLVLLDRSVLHTTMHPYFNQTWGFMALPYVLVLARPAVEGRERGPRALLALFLVVLALAYPLALPIAGAALVAAWAAVRCAHGLPVRPRGLRRRLWRGPRSLLWIVPVLVVGWLPIIGVIEKGLSAGAVVLPGTDLGAWGGDLVGFLPWEWFVGAETPAALVWVLPALLAGLVLALRRADADVRWAYGAVLAFGALAAAYFRLREGGWYFHFKVLAFTAPLAVAVAAVGLARLRRAGPLILAAWVLTAAAGARLELLLTFDQLPRSTLALREVAERLPGGASVRLDVPPNEQLWVAYLLAPQRLCSERPLLGTSYPRVPISRRADWMLVRRYRDRPLPRPADAAPGPPAMVLEDFVLYRQAPGAVAGPENCSQRMETSVPSRPRD